MENKEQTHYYLIGGEIKKGGEMPTEDNNDYRYTLESQLEEWQSSLQPCSITDVEMEKVKQSIYIFDKPIEVTDIVEEKRIVDESYKGEETSYKTVLVFKVPKSEANEVVIDEIRLKAPIMNATEFYNYITSHFTITRNNK